jgi:hypothetical protein
VSNKKKDEVRFFVGQREKDKEKIKQIEKEKKATIEKKSDKKKPGP